MKDTYNKAKILEFSGATIKVHSPILEEKERKRRMTQIHKQAEKLLKEVI